MPIKELYNLLDYNKRRLIEMIAENIGNSETLDQAINPRVAMTSLIHLTKITRELEISAPTASRMVKEFQQAGLLTVHEVGRAKIIMPTPKMKEICEALKE